MKKISRYLLFFLVLAIIVCAAAAGWLAHYATQPLQPPQTPLAFTLPKGSSLRGIANQFVELGVLREPWKFIALANVRGQATTIQAGSYELTSPLTPLELLDKITRGEVSQSVITFVEGWTFRQMRKALDEHKALKHDSVGLSEAEIMQAIGAVETSPEGLFFPETYSFQHGASDISVLKRAYAEMKAHVDALWDARTDGLPFSDRYEAITLASVVEKETGFQSERAMIAAVFVNRLRLGMRLQTDPTVIYGMGENFDGNLRKRDLTDDTPYNSYTRTGLPPTPIAMPGLAALTATLRPAQSRVLYFVSRGDGSSQFSESLAEHNRAVVKYQKTPRRKSQ